MKPSAPYSLAILSLLAVSCAGKSGPRFDPLDLSTTPSLTQYPDSGAVVLFDRGVLRMAIDSKSRRPLGRLRRYRRLKVLREKGISSASRIFVDVEPGNRVRNLQARITLPGGKRHLFGQSDFEREYAEDGRVRLALSVKNMTPGTIVEHTADIIMSDLRFVKPWAFQSQAPTVRSEYSVIVPRGFEVDFRFSEQGQFVQRPPERFETEAGTRFFWSRANAPPLFEEPSMAAESLLAARAHVMFLRVNAGSVRAQGFDSWESVAAWFAERAGFWWSLSEETKQEAKRIAGNGTVEKRALRLAETVVRDFQKPDRVVPLRRAKLEPPEALLRRGGGSTASAGLLLVSLMRAAGLRALPGLAVHRNTDVLTPDYPTARPFDRVIAVVETKKKTFFLDPLEPTLDARVPPNSIQGGFVLVVGREPRLMSVPVSAPRSSSTNVKLEISLNRNGYLRGTYHAHFTGAEAGALRRRLLRAQKASHTLIVSEFLKERGAPFTVSTTRIQGLTALRSSLLLEGSIALSSLTPPESGEWFLKVNRFIGQPGPGPREFRRTPLQLGAPRQLKISARLRLPRFYKTLFLPDPVKKAWAGGRYSLTCKKVGSTKIRMTRFEEQRKIQVPINQYQEYVRYRTATRSAEAEQLGLQLPGYDY